MFRHLELQHKAFYGSGRHHDAMVAGSMQRRLAIDERYHLRKIPCKTKQGPSSRRFALQNWGQFCKESSGAMQSQRSRSSTNCVMNRADQFWLSATQEVAFYAGARLSSFLTSLSTKPFNCSPKGQLRSPESRNPQVQTVLCTPRKGNKSTKRGPAF